MDILEFPSHFPPTEKWKKFFIGVRWLGPDLSFFNSLKQMQAARSIADMSQWGGGERQILAEKISRILHKQLGWLTPIFVPQDVATVSFYGPSFGIIDADIAFDDMVKMLRKDYSLAPTISFWESMANSTLGELIDGLLALR
ncbi:hypothetical protein [Duganella phyllosphaerae]|uniref:hypothetical protein n=1 Tax=Duganella phyllosphaerae TaxID=762836 RepID=UPI0008754865|nr:hypothetical protein [Duganella phyllosphaerae]